MTRKPARGLFITGVDTGAGKTYVGCRIAADLRRAGRRVGVYKPVESGCPRNADGQLVAEDALALWTAAGEPENLDAVCPQRFEAPLAPHLAARQEGRQVDPMLLRQGVEFWSDRCEVLIVEGAGGLMSPLGDEDYVADLALDFGFPLVVVAANRLGVINQTLQTLIAAATFREGIAVAGVVLSNVVDRAEAAADESLSSNAAELRQRCVPPLLAELPYGADAFEPPVDWWDLSDPR